MYYRRFLIREFEGWRFVSLAYLGGSMGSSFGSFLGETEGPFLGADLRSFPAGAEVGSRRLRAEGVDALTPPSTRRG
jgi:hypothetical protein